MAQQKGLIKLRGAVGGITFYKTQDGYMARESTSINGKKVATHPSYQRTRENAKEFAQTIRAGALLIRAFRGILRKSVDGRLGSRLTKELYNVIRADVTSARGSRNVVNGELGLLKDFEFNAQSSLAGTIYAPFTTNVDRVTGEVTVECASFIPMDMIVAPSGATHYQIRSAAGTVNFEASTFAVDAQEMVPALWDGVANLPYTQSHTLPANSSDPIFVLVGILFYQEVGGVQYLLNEGQRTPFAIVHVDTLP